MNKISKKSNAQRATEGLEMAVLIMALSVVVIAFYTYASGLRF